MRSGVTLADVASRAGVSPATASKVFNGRSDVAAATRERVSRAATEVGYVPTPRRPTSAGTTVWVAFDTIANHYSGSVLEGLLSQAFTLDALVVVSQWRGAVGHDPQPGSPAWVRQGLDRGASAFILITTPVTRAHVDACAGQAPLMVLDPASIAPESAMSVGATNWRGGVQATEYLLGLGHRRVAFVGYTPTSTPGIERLAGFRNTMESAGAPVPARLIRPGGFTYDDGVACAEVLGGPDRPTAVFAANDAVALGVFEAARRVGLRIPEELSVIGFDDSYAAQGTSPLLTTIRQPLTEMGRIAMRSVVEGARHGPSGPVHLQLATTLVERGSCAPPAPRT